MHWRVRLDLKEEECRIRLDQAGEKLVVVRYIALNLLTEETNFKAGEK